MFRTRFIQFSSSSRNLFSASSVLFGSYAGVIRKWENGSRFGFVRDDDSGQSIFVHRSNCVWENPNDESRIIQVGTRVSYDLAFDTRKADGTKRCENVTLEDGEKIPSSSSSSTSDNNNNNNQHREQTAYRGRRDSEGKKDPLLEEFRDARDLSGTIRVKPRMYGFLDFVPEGHNGKKYSLFFHRDDIIGNGEDLEAGSEVLFDLVEDRKKPGAAKAANVVPKPNSNKNTSNNNKKPVVKEFDIDNF